VISDWPVRTDPIFGCLLWTARVNDNGYAIIWRGRRPRNAVRIVYEAEVGPIGEGLFPDHLCRRRLCVAWWHVEPVTKDENERRKLWRYRVRMKTCPRGHGLALHAVVTPEGGRVCRLCNAAALAR
jgi:hypothetical protein